MKMIIKSGKRKFFIIFPNAFILNRFSARIILKIIKAKNLSENISLDDIKKLFGAVKRYKRFNRRWTAVDITDSRGDRILIKI